MAAFCAEVGDPRVAMAVAAMAKGLRFSEVCDAVNIDKTTLGRWRAQYPLEQLAAVECQARARPAMMRLTANLEEAARVLERHTRGDVDRRNLGVERLRQGAARATIALVERVLATAEENRRDPSTYRKPIPAHSRVVESLSNEQLVAVARAARERLAHSSSRPYWRPPPGTNGNGAP